MSVPKQIPCVEITLSSACHDLVDVSHRLSHDEDSDDLRNVFFHFYPLQPFADLVVHELVDVEVGTCFEKFLAGVLHLDHNCVPFVSGAEKVERHAPLAL